MKMQNKILKMLSSIIVGTTAISCSNDNTNIVNENRGEEKVALEEFRAVMEREDENTIIDFIRREGVDTQILIDSDVLNWTIERKFYNFVCILSRIPNIFPDNSIASKVLNFVMSAPDSRGLGSLLCNRSFPDKVLVDAKILDWLMAREDSGCYIKIKDLLSRPNFPISKSIEQKVFDWAISRGKRKTARGIEVLIREEETAGVIEVLIKRKDFSFDTSVSASFLKWAMDHNYNCIINEFFDRMTPTEIFVQVGFLNWVISGNNVNVHTFVKNLVSRDDFPPEELVQNDIFNWARKQGFDDIVVALSHRSDFSFRIEKAD